MIFLKTKYKIYYSKFLAIINTFKTQQYYLKSYKYRFLIFINHNNFCHFISIKKSQFQIGLVKFKNLFIIIFKLIIANIKQMQLQMLYLLFLKHFKEKNLYNRAENIQNIHYLQVFLTNASFLGLNISFSLTLSPLYQVFINKIHIFCSYVNFRIYFMVNQLIIIFTKLILEV